MHIFGMPSDVAHNQLRHKYLPSYKARRSVLTQRNQPKTDLDLKDYSFFALSKEYECAKPIKVLRYFN